VYHADVRGSVGALTITVLGLLIATACGGETRHVTLGRVATMCPTPADGVTLQVLALGDFPDAPGLSQPIGMPISSTLFPGTTRALTVTVLGAGGTVRAVGRTGTIDLDTVPDRATLEVFTAPPRSFCQVGSLSRPRARPLVARAGNGVIVAGGSAGGAERYDPSTGMFTALASEPAGDLTGGSIATLADGRVLFVRAGHYQLYDPATQSFGSDAAGIAVHDLAQLARLRDGRVLVAGGCMSGSTLPCPAAADALLYDPSTDHFESAPPLASARAGGQAFVDVDGAVWLIGGTDQTGAPLTTWERWDPMAGGVAAMGTGATAAPLPAGGLLGGFAVQFADGSATGNAGATIVSPGGTNAVSRAPGIARAGATMATLDDGSVLMAFGDGGALSTAQLFTPGDLRIAAVDATMIPVRANAGAALLDDGTLLIVGGAAGTTALGDAWIYRHDLLGPWSSVPVQTFAPGGITTPLVVAADPAHAAIEPADPGSHPARFVLGADTMQPGALSNWAVLSGPRYQDATVTATVSAMPQSGVAILLGVSPSGDALAVVADPAHPITVAPLSGGILGAPVCTGTTNVPIDAFTHDVGATTFLVDAHDGKLTVTIGGLALVTCDLPAYSRGLAGVGLLAGATPGQLSLDALEVTR
jgi:hypothetical protein